MFISRKVHGMDENEYNQLPHGGAVDGSSGSGDQAWAWVGRPWARSNHVKSHYPFVLVKKCHQIAAASTTGVSEYKFNETCRNKKKRFLIKPVTKYINEFGNTIKPVIYDHCFGRKHAL